LSENESRHLVGHESSFKEAWITVERLSVLLGMLAMAFVAGSNWHRIDALDGMMAETKKAVAEDVQKEDLYFVRKDVLAEQLNAIKSQLDELKRLVEKKNANER
jgi:Tfp pilus assembly protein PilO